MAQTCTVKSKYDAVTYCPGQRVLPGNRKRAYFIPKHAIKTWPTRAKNLEGASGDAKKMVSYEGEFVLDAETKWQRLDAIYGKIKFSYETQGSDLSRTVLNKLELSHPVLDEEAAAFAAQVICDDIVVAFQRADGKFRLIGCEEYETQTDTSGDTGEKVTDESGMKVTISCTDIAPAPFFPGTLDTADGKISGADGSVSPEAA